MMKLLIVDDNSMMRQTIRTIVASPVDEVVECGDGSTVIPAYEALRPDWVLMDVKMQGMNGIQATRKLKAAHPEARVVIVSNSNDQEFRDAATAAGAEDYFLKDNLPAIRQRLDVLPKRES
ncbi:MAG: response regulator transcription factor [Bacteroidota bacterium]